MSTSALPIADYSEQEDGDESSTRSEPIDLVQFRRRTDALPAISETSEYRTQILHPKGPGRTHGVSALMPAPVFPLIPKLSRRAHYFTSLQKWEGIVLEIYKETFLGRLVDQTSSGLDEEAEFSLAEVSEDDRELLAPGAVFYWNIGYNDSPSGQRTRVSVIRFRRLPAWSEREIEDAERKAEQLGELIGWK